MMNAAINGSELRSKWALFIYNKQLGLAWVVAALLGIFVISMSQQLDAKRFFLPVLIMLVYSVVAFNRGHEIFRSLGSSDSYQNTLISQLADSVYFLGFLWTLWALIDSFVLKSDTAATSIFRTFGYALVTTSCGMFLRLAILQFRYTAIDQGSEAEVSIEEKLQRFGASVHSAETVLHRWREAVADSSTDIATVDQELRNTLKAITEEMRASMMVITKQHSEMITATAERSRAGIEEIVRSAKTEIVGLTTGVAAPLRSEMGELADTLKRSNASLSKTLPKLTERTLAWVAEVEQTEESLCGLRSGLRDTEHSLEDLQRSGANVIASLQEIEAAQQALNKTLEEAFKGIGHVASEAIKEGLRTADWSGAVAINVDDQKVLEAIRRITDELQATKNAVAAGIERCVTEVKKLPAAEGMHTGAQDAIKVVQQELIPILHNIREQSAAHKPWWPFGTAR